MATNRPVGVRKFDYDINQPKRLKAMDFIRHYVTMEKKDPYEAAIKAGYKSKGEVSRLMKTPWIIDEIANRMEESNFRAKVTTDTIKIKLLELIDGCMQRVPVLDDEGNDTGLFKFMDAGTARGAIKDLGEHVDVQAFVKNFKADINHTHNIQSDVDLSKLPIEDQQKLLEIVMKAKSAQVVDGPPKRIESTIINQEEKL